MCGCGCQCAKGAAEAGNSSCAPPRALRFLHPPTLAVAQGRHAKEATRRAGWNFVFSVFNAVAEQLNWNWSSVLHKGYTCINQTGDEPQKQDTQANKRTPLLREEVPYQITLIRLRQWQGILDRRRREKVNRKMFSCSVFTLHGG